MRISEKFQEGKTVFSLEVFPPKKNSPIETIYETIDAIHTLQPDFISVTYGAGGNPADGSTCEIADMIQNRYGLDACVHLTCLNNSKEDIDINIQRFQAAGIENILALRGDRNPDRTPKEDFPHAVDLIRYLKENSSFHISAACYPEIHPEATSPQADIAFLKEKVEAGATHLMSQLFFDNDVYFDWLEAVRNAGIHVPIEAGVMPVVNKKQIERMVTLCGASLPTKFVKMMQKYEPYPEALRDAGIAYAINQIIDLLSRGVDGIHLYTMNNPYVAKKISDTLGSLLHPMA